MRQSVKQCGRELGIGKDGWPLREAQVSGDDQAGLLVELAHEVKQQCATDLAERQIAQFIKDDEIDVRHAVGELALLAVELFLLERVHEFHGGQEPDPPMVVDDGLHADRCGDVRLAGAGTADEYDVFGLVEELTAMQGLHLTCRDAALGEVCPSSNKWDRCLVLLRECFAHHFHITRRVVEVLTS